MRWEAFIEEVPAIGEEAEARFRRDQLVMVGTLRKDGSPRISPCEVDFAAGRMLHGMMWRSPKALDLLRDPRVVIHSVTVKKDGSDGDVKIYGRALDVQDPTVRQAFREEALRRIGWAPDEPDYHLFEIDVTGAATTRFDGGRQRIQAWNPTDGLREWEKDG
jgi:hypothetical protein